MLFLVYLGNIDNTVFLIYLESIDNTIPGLFG